MDLPNQVKRFFKITSRLAGGIFLSICLLRAVSIYADDEKIISGQVDNNSMQMVRGQLSDTQSIDIEESPGVNLVNNTANSNTVTNTNNANNASTALQSAKSVTHGASIIDKSSKSKKSFELSGKAPKTAWRKKKIVGAQSIDPKANIIQSKKLQDMETKRKNMRESRKKELESKPARKLLKPNSEEKEDAP